MSKVRLFHIGFVTLGLAAAFAVPAEARIECHDGYQIVQGHALATPYCQDDLLARVAREHGMKETAQAIRSNPNYKLEVCRLAGRDIRVRENCINAFPGSRGR